MILRKEGFDPWTCSGDFQIGIHLEHLNKVLKCMGAKDELVFKSPDEGKVSHFSLKLMEIDQERLGIPETD